MKKIELKEKEILATIVVSTGLTKGLLDNKGFTKSYEQNFNNLIERSVLLISEVSELADATKKKLGKEEEAFEIADILIRMCGYCLMFPLIEEEIEKRCFENNEELRDYILYNNYDLYNQTEYIKKIAVINDIHTQVFQLNTTLESLFNSISNLNNHYKEELIESAVDCMEEIIIICQFYTKTFIGNSNLLEIIIEKIEKNYLRPTGYGYGDK